MQLGGAWSTEQAVPRLRPDAGDTAQPAVWLPGADGSLKARQRLEQVPHGPLAAGIDRHHQEDRGPRQRTQDRLWHRHIAGFSPRPPGRSVSKLTAGGRSIPGPRAPWSCLTLTRAAALSVETVKLTARCQL